ncbi:MAG TPA: hypothetical protein VFH59_03645 [Frateuria sp.]|uniref:hypothetical protein n=1 Tax=Frateuria sp. TaxID=2211372 RepID=UPI002D7F8FAE|nr:hypothetical protein [Frateuria sp.]HET6804521.1 hypothetical protein [Frateuria sp.]
MIKLLPCRALCAGLVVLGLSASALAAEPSGTGLGQSWPNAQDVSASVHWHVYAFNNNGVRYIQVNDLNGNVRVAFATANGQFLVLPMGRDAQDISTPQQAIATSSTAVPLRSYTETLYRDSGVQLDATPMSDGTTMFTAAQTSTLAAPSCDSDPAECNTHLN